MRKSAGGSVGAWCLTFLMAVGCDNSPTREAQTGGTNAETQLRAGADSTNKVAVRLMDYEITMPKELPAGKTAFDVTNAGSVVHSFEVEGQGIEREFESVLQPGQIRTLEVNLAPGTYKVYCPVANHAERGMEMQLTVR